MSELLVSVVIPVFNGRRFIAEALESVLAQTRPAAEIIVVDDGSTDGTDDVIRSTPAVSLIQISHQGVSVARNIGVAASGGTLLAFLDADDTWHPEKLERQVEFLNSSPEFGIVMCHQDYCFEGPIPRWFRGPRDGGSEPGFMPSAWLLHRATWNRVGAFSPGLTHSEDTDWLARANDVGIPVGVVPETLVTHRIHDANASGMAEDVRIGMLRTLRESVHRKQGLPG